MIPYLKFNILGDYNFDGELAYKFKVVLFKAKLRYLSGGAGCLIMCLWLERKWVGACERVPGLEASCGGPGGGRHARLW